ncbi:MAG: alpha/beta hydrolase [Gimesia sp.]|jgi:pimeloyl-ACP methyl ester carboxylesterase|uniref:Alpha/beta hydrolase n=1 Tax=Gimesia maris TaxID=122 RepID=A0A3D3R2N8_9PLAN|nr:alpha/beta hydrolase [Gimesia sp.]HCO23134.1 alpha/beta hydrolase [Gimesia maris]|tara:strand:- start:529 stop:1386 length:858 start_codon:yes stop_codon:yes gene_type:complete
MLAIDSGIMGPKDRNMHQKLVEQNVNGIRMRALIAGSGPPLLLVHGFPLSHKMWLPQIEYFQSRYTVIAPDLRGFGESDISSGIVTMEQHARDLNSLLKELNIEDPVVFCGLSMGGYIAWEFWKHFADQLHALILCDTRADADSEEGVNNRLKMADLVLRHGPEAISTAMIPNLISESSQQKQPHLSENLIAMIEAADSEGIAASQKGMAARSDYSNQIENIRIPTLFIVGSDDRLTPPEIMLRMSSQVPGSKYFEVGKVGHMAPMEAPEAVNREIDHFLTSSNF